MDACPEILSIDDNPINQKLIAKSLAPNYVVHQAMSAHEGLKRLASLAPDLILLDIDMPGMDGYQCCQEIRRAPDFRETPVLFLSCLNDPEDQLRGYQAGADDFISKPFNLAVLKAKIARNIERMPRTMRAHGPAAGLNADKRLNTFLLACLDANSIGELHQRINQACIELHLSFAVRCRDEHGQRQTLGSIADPSALEKVLLEEFHSQLSLGSGSRILISTGHFSLLVRSMPSALLARGGELEQFLQQVLKAAERRAAQIKSPVLQGVKLTT